MNTMKVHAPVLAVDVGYGNTKIAFRNGSDVSTFMFPSLTPPYKAHTIAKESAGLITTPKTVAVDVEGKRYQVGPGVLVLVSVVVTNVVVNRLANYENSREAFSLRRWLAALYDAKFAGLLSPGRRQIEIIRPDGDGSNAGDERGAGLGRHRAVPEGST